MFVFIVATKDIELTMSLMKGACFSTYEEVRVAIKKHEEEIGVLYVIKSSNKVSWICLKNIYNHAINYKHKLYSI